MVAGRFSKFVIAGLLAACCLPMLAAPVAASSVGCVGAGCDNKDPKTTHCWDSSTVKSQYPLVYSGKTVGLVQLRYSSACQAAFTAVKNTGAINARYWFGVSIYSTAPLGPYAGGGYNFWDSSCGNRCIYFLEPGYYWLSPMRNDAGSYEAMGQGALCYNSACRYDQLLDQTETDWF